MDGRKRAITGARKVSFSDLNVNGTSGEITGVGSESDSLDIDGTLSLLTRKTKRKMAFWRRSDVIIFGLDFAL